jgi:ATP-binding cassette, subfamily B, bacterial PglK
MLKKIFRKFKFSKYLHEVFFLLGNDSSKLPVMLVLFFIISIFELIGIGLIGPYIILVSDPNKIEDLLDGFNNLLNISLDGNNLLITLSIGLIVVFFIKSILTIFTNYVILKFSNSQRVKIQSLLMKNYQSLPYASYVMRNSSDYVHSIQILADRFASGVLLSGIRVCNEGIIAIAILTLLAWSNFSAFAILLILVSSVMFLYDRIFRKKMLDLGIRSVENETFMLQGVNEGIEGLKELRILGMQEYFLNKVTIGAKGYGDCYVYSSTISTSPRYLLEIIMMFFVVSLVIIELYFYGNAQSILPTLGIFGVAAIRLLPSVNLISNSIASFRYSRNSISRLYKDISGFRANNNIINKNFKKVDFDSIEILNLFFKYEGAKKDTLNNINLKINKGESIGIIGASGSGKTTLIDVLLGLLSPNKGIISFNGNDLNPQLDSWQSHIAYLPQQIFIIDDTLRKNIALGVESNNIDDDKVIAAITKASLQDFLEELPLALDTVLGERGIRISGGQRQRVALARAFYHDRDVLFMDESTSALDSETEKEVVKEILNLKGQRTVVVIAHRLNTLKHCDRIYKLEGGVIVDIGVLDKNCNFISMNQL